jgi:uncharacterized protein (TIGR02600 family)
MEPQLTMNPRKPLVEAVRVSHSQKGMALVIVLAVLVLLAGLVVAFFSTVTSDASSSAVSSNDARAKQFADSAVNLVMGQIVEATKGFKPGGNTDANRLAWASQPGAIRTYDASGSAFQVFKLYSSPTMVGSGNLTFSSDLPTSADEAAISSGNHSIFTDLNSPVVDGGNQTVFPIADPAALGSVEGFTATTDATIGVTVVSGNSSTRRLPMPTRWLYMLKDGTLAAATGNSSTATVTGASAANPIVGRVAFWTDDETSKVNINTAGEGTYWDVPRLYSSDDWDFANFQPAQKEFQRYPGHPAMTSLAPVFFATSNTTTGNITQTQRDAIYSVVPRIVGGGSNAGTAIATGALTPDADRLYASVDELIFTANRTAQGSNSAITANSTRQRAFFLTASSRAPEVTIFNTPRVSMWPITLKSSTITGNRTTAFDNLIAFCSTINGTAYYFQRQDSLSPTNDWANILRNRQLLRYLQTLSDKPVPGFGASLVSKTSASDRDQLLVEMLDYIRSTNLYDDNLSPNTYASQADADNAVQFTKGRSTAVSAATGSQLDTWTGHGVVAPLRVPAGLADGTTSNNSTLMGFGRFHTISEAGLLFICNADGASGNLTAPRDGNGTAFLSTNNTINNGTLSGGNLIFSSNVTTTGGNVTINATQLAQMISNNTINGTTINYYLNTINSTITEISSAATTYNGSRALGGIPLATNQRRIQALLFFDYFTPMHGWTQFGMDGSMDVEITGDMEINGQKIQMMDLDTGATRTETRNFDNYGMHTCHPWGANVGYRKIFSTWNDAARSTGGTASVPERGVMPADGSSGNVYRRYGLISAPITVTVPPGANPTMRFTGPASLRVKFYSRPSGSTRVPARSAADLVQTIELNFPSADFPIPVLKHTGTDTTGGAAPTTPENWWAFHLSGAISGRPGRLNYISQRPFDTAGTLVQPSDTLRTLVPYHGDTRFVAGSHFVPAGVFQPSTFYFDTTRKDNMTDADTYARGGTDLALAPPQIQSYLTGSAHTYSESYWAHYRPPQAERLVENANYNYVQFPKFPGIAVSNTDRRSARPFQQWGDFDNGVAYTVDGPYINKPDEGNTARDVSGVANAGIPYFSQAWQQVAGGATFFSPNRQVPSAGMFGSLPTRLRSGNVAYNAAAPSANVNNTWRTLLFRPQSGHPGATNPPEHLWTDFFWMPVVEPYAISEPFSTAGKINMNYAIAPFNYITRKTGMAALLRAEKIPAFLTSNASTYKSSNSTITTRLNLDINETLKQWDTKFAGNQLFVSSSQICDLHLVPQGQTVSGMSTFWSSRAITGDNSRERPYTNLLGRLTTKSNSFTVHFRVQVLKKSPTTPADQWVEGRDIVASEYRGSTLIERYIDPNNTSIPDFATTASANIDDYYRFRVIQTRRFAP